jgi:hypothetical protein
MKEFTIIPKEQGYDAILLPDGFAERHTPHIGDFLVVYEDGYMSISPPGPFVSGYTQIKPGEPEQPLCGACVHFEVCRFIDLDSTPPAKGFAAVPGCPKHIKPKE